MVVVNEFGYLQRAYTKRNWWLVKSSPYNHGQITLNSISLPSKYVGKRIRIKVEIITDGDEKDVC